MGFGNREELGVSEGFSSAQCGPIFSSGCVEKGNFGMWRGQEGQVQGLGLTRWQGKRWGWREAGLGGRRDQGERLDFWLIIQGPVTLWLFGTYLGLVLEQMSWDQSGVGRRWLWPRGTESNIEGSDLP